MQGWRAELELGPVGARRRHGPGKGGRRVDDEEIAWSEEPRQVAKAAVDDAPLPPRGDEQADAVAGNATSLWRLVRLEADVLLDSAHADAATRSRAR